MPDSIRDEDKMNAQGADASGSSGARRLLSWPNWLFVGVLVYTCYQHVIHDTTQLPDYILIIEAIGNAVWLVPFALVYNIQGGKKAKLLYVGANIALLLILLI